MFLCFCFAPGQHWESDFFIVTNADGCKNSKLVSAPIRHETRGGGNLFYFQVVFCRKKAGFISKVTANIVERAALDLVLAQASTKWL